MELKIANPYRPNLSDQLGISPQRVREFEVKLNALIHVWVRAEACISKSLVFQEIASFCNTPEELIFCIHEHDNFMFTALINKYEKQKEFSINN